jgi:branched-chain amino acid transport system substrate-binding protein
MMLAVLLLCIANAEDPYNLQVVRTRAPFNSTQKFIHLGCPITIDANKKFFAYGRWAMNSWDLVCDWINNKKGGINIGGDIYKVMMTYINDNSAGASGVAAAKYLIEQEKVDFLVGPYSSGITKAISDQVTEPKKMILAAGMAAATSAFAGKKYLFGTFVPSSTYMTAILQEFKTKHELTSSTKLKVGYFSEDASFTKGVCGGITSNAGSIGVELDSEGMVIVKPDANEVELGKVIEGFRNRSVDVVFGCTYFNTCVRFVKVSKNMAYSPKGIALSSCVDSEKFLSDLGSDGKYIVGPASWYKGQGGRSLVTNYSSPEWNADYASRFAEEPPYQAASAYTAPMVLLDAIEKAQSLDSTTIMDELRKPTYMFPGFYGEVVFDSNMQNSGAIFGCFFFFGFLGGVPSHHSQHS